MRAIWHIETRLVVRGFPGWALVDGAAEYVLRLISLLLDRGDAVLDLDSTAFSSLYPCVFGRNRNMMMSQSRDSGETGDPSSTDMV